MDSIQFKDKVAVITGSGAGLGRIYALEFAKRGASVVVNDPGGTRDGSGKSTSVADSVVQEIIANGGNAVASYDSVASMDGGKQIVQTAVDTFGKVDILINNAGILRDKTILRLTEDDWDSVISVHLKGAFCVSQAAFAAMKKNNYGRIVNTVSGAGLYGNYGQANYCAAKMGLVGLMNGLSIEGTKYNIKCNTIAPVAASRMTEDIFTPEMIERLKPEYVAPIVLYLASEKNQETKMIFNCAGGWFSRSEIVCASGKLFDITGDKGRKITPEIIAENWSAISDIGHAKPLETLVDAFSYIYA
jgi:NAD(P)-dependent dehydrogenase (short-subunit alcohol dehydrogenase family)